MENKYNYSFNLGINYMFLIWLVMFVAKVTGYIDWSWWVVFIPLMPIGLVMAIAACVIVLAIVVAILLGIYYLFLKIYEKYIE